MQETKSVVLAGDAVAPKFTDNHEGWLMIDTEIRKKLEALPAERVAAMAAVEKAAFTALEEAAINHEYATKEKILKNRLRFVARQLYRTRPKQERADLRTGGTITIDGEAYCVRKIKASGAVQVVGSPWPTNSILEFGGKKFRVVWTTDRAMGLHPERA